MRGKIERKKGRGGERKSGRRGKKIRMTASKARRRVGGSSWSAFTADCTQFWIETGLMAG